MPSVVPHLSLLPQAKNMSLLPYLKDMSPLASLLGNGKGQPSGSDQMQTGPYQDSGSGMSGSNNNYLYQSGAPSGFIGRDQETPGSGNMDWTQILMQFLRQAGIIR